MIFFCGGIQRVQAQTDLTGSVYENEDMMDAMMDSIMGTIDDKLDSARTANIAKMEKEKGRTLTASELKEMDAQLQKSREIMMAMKKAMRTNISVEFMSPKDLVLRMKMEVDDNALKMAGVSWVKRKAIKVGLAIMPEKQKATYEVKGDLVITKDGNDLDTMRISPDRKYLYVEMDEEHKYTLVKTK